MTNLKKTILSLIITFTMAIALVIGVVTAPKTSANGGNTSTLETSISLGKRYDIIKSDNTLDFSYQKDINPTAESTKVYQYHFKNIMNDNMAVKMHKLESDDLTFEYAVSNTEQTDTTLLTFKDTLNIQPLAPKGQAKSEIYVYVKVTATDDITFSSPIKWTFGHAQNITCYYNGEVLGDPILGICNAGVINVEELEELTPEVEEGYEVTWCKDDRYTISEQFPLNESSSVVTLHARVPNLPTDWLTPTDDGYMVVKGSTSLDAGELIIPETYNGEPVISIADGDLESALQGDLSSCVFGAQTELTDIHLPNTMTHVGMGAFAYCTGLTNVILPDNIQVLNVGAFAYCMGLQTIKLPKNLTALYDLTFAECVSLTHVDASYSNIQSIGGMGIGGVFSASGDYGFSQLQTINLTGCNQLTSIGMHAFRESFALTGIAIPDSVTSIEDYAFYGCMALTSITIPDSVTSIASETFAACASLTSIVVESGNSVYDSRDNCNAIIETSSNTLVVGCKNTIIPSDVTAIGAFAFDYCEGLTSITIPDSVTSIGYQAFGHCYGLTNITIPDRVTDIGDHVFYICDNLASITIPRSVTSIGSSAFDDCNALASVEFEENSQLTTIGAWAFYGCAFTSITIPDSVRNIENNAFAECASLSSVNFGDNSQLGYISNGLFSGCNALTSITIPSSVTSIGYHAFPSCLTSIEFEANSRLTSIGDSAFWNCDALTNITIPSGVTSIDRSAFEYCDGLTSITIPSSVTTIGDQAFSGCEGLISVYFEDNSQLKSLGERAIQSCSSLISVDFGDNSQLTSIGDYAFIGCEKLASVDFGTNSQLQSIGVQAFYKCGQLTSITIPSSVTSISIGVFLECYGLTGISFDDETTWYATASKEDWQNMTGGEQVDVSDPDQNVEWFNFYSSAYYKYYWYKK